MQCRTAVRKQLHKFCRTLNGRDLLKAAVGSRNETGAEHQLLLTSGFTTSREVLMNSSASGLSALFFKVVIAIVPRALCSLIGNALSEECLAGNSKV